MRNGKQLSDSLIAMMLRVGAGGALLAWAHCGVAAASAAVAVNSDILIENGDASMRSPTEVYQFGTTGAASLVVRNGGLAQGRDLFFGYAAGKTGVLTVTGPGSQLTAIKEGSNDETGRVDIAERGNGSITITNGGRVESNRAYSAFYQGSSADMLVDGPGSIWVNHSHFYVGTSGTSTLLVQNGGRIESYRSRVGEFAGSVGVATVRGTGTRWDTNQQMSVGAYANSRGTLNVEAGAEITAFEGNIGRFLGGTGVVNVSGAGSKWTGVTQMHVGYLGSATLNVSDGARIESGWTTIGHADGATGHAVLRCAGSSWSAVGAYNDVLGPAMNVGYWSHGTLEILEGALLESKAGAVGSARGASSLGTGLTTSGVGVALVDGANSTWRNTQTLVIGRTFGTDGTLGITNGGRVENTKGYLGAVAGSIGRASVVGAGSYWQNSQSLYVGGNESGAGGTAELRVQDGAAVSVAGNAYVYAGGLIELSGGTITIGGSGGVELHGALVGRGQVSGQVMNVDGVVRPGNGTVGLLPLLSMGDSYVQQSNGEFHVDVFGNGMAGKIAVIEQGGTATLAGRLTVRIVPGYVPGVGSEYEIISAAGGVVGTFTNYDLPQLGGQPVFEVVYDAHTVTLRTLREYRCKADLDLDLDVDGNDVALFIACASGPAIPLSGDQCRAADFDADNDVDQEDFGVLQRCFSGTGSPARPECGE